MILTVEVYETCWNYKTLEFGLQYTTQELAPNKNHEDPESTNPSNKL